jgi:hypothetical protein
MNKKYILIVSVIGIVLLGLSYILFSPKEEPKNIEYTPYAASDEDAIVNTVEVFGSKLQYVSLTQSLSEIQSDMDTQYAPYLTYTLLEAWKKNPNDALGREVISPYPNKIAVDDFSITKDEAVVKGTVIEIVPDGEEVFTYPIEITLERVDGRWLITSVSK